MHLARSTRLRMASLGAVLSVLVVLAGCGVSGKDDARPPVRRSTTTQPTTATAPTTSSPSTTPSSGLPSGGWVAVRDGKSGFTFQLPKEPTVLRPSVTAPDGSAVTVRGYQALVNRNLLVQVSVYDLAGRSFDADKAIDGVASTAGGRVVSRKHTASGDLDVVDAKIRISSRSALGYDRVFKIGDRAVQLWTLGLDDRESEIRAVQQQLSSSFRAN